MKTFSKMKDPDLLLTRAAYCLYLKELHDEMVKNKTYKTNNPDKDVLRLRKNLTRTLELIQAINLQFPKMTLAEFWVWRDKKD